MDFLNIKQNKYLSAISIVYCFILLSFYMPVLAQTEEHNTITSAVWIDEVKNHCLTTVQYYDGLGQLKQIVEQEVTPKKADLISIPEYDDYGREIKAWLPTPVKNNSGKFKDPEYVKTIAMSSNGYSDSDPFYETYYEESPQNRIIMEFGAGQNWRGVKTEYLTNTIGGVLSCAFYEATSDEKLKKTNLSYPENQLFITKITDEDGKVSYEFKNKLGQVILTRQINNGQNHDTYYVYDDFGNKRFVLPPVLSDSLINNGPWIESEPILQRYAYVYRYDGRNRLIAKRLPGCEWIYYVYDKADRLILSQDGEQRLKKEWTFNKYDAFGRIILSGIYISSFNHAYLQTQYKSIVVKEEVAAGKNYGYTWNTPPTVPIERVYTINYYDDYNRMLNLLPIAVNDSLSYKRKSGYEKYVTSPPYNSNLETGLLVGTRVKLLDGSGEIVTAMYYDSKGNIFQKRSTNLLGGYDKEYYKYNIADQVTKSFSEQTVPGMPTVTEAYTYEYDHAGRLTKTLYKLDNQTEIEQSVLTYDELGRVKSKKSNNSSSTLTNYSYNLRGYLTSLNSPYFSEFLTYETTSWIGGTPCYNGNISSIMTAMDGGDSWLEYNRYYYDGLNRLTSGGYFDWPSYLKNTFSYDKNGNIKTQQLVDADGMGITNTYKYDGNRLLSFESTGGGSTFYNTYSLMDNAWHFADGSHITTEYEYDKNGNMTTDRNKGISKIQYNYLNLPSLMQMNRGGHMAEYIYDASGVKRKEINKTSTGTVTVPLGTLVPLTSNQIRYTEETYYMGNKEYYKNASGTLLLKKIHTSEGYVAVDGTQRIHHTYIKDHLGSVRIDLPFTGNRYNYCYFPFGMDYVTCQDGSHTVNPLTTARFSGKERMPMFGMNFLDFDARLYDPLWGRWNVMDPLCEKYYSVSPYAYCLNNPINAIDPNGMDVYLLRSDGRRFLAKKTDDDYDQLYATKSDEGGHIVSIVENPLRVNDTGLLPQLQGKNGATAETSSSTDAFNVFKFAADNSNVEWSLKGYGTEGGGTGFLLLTSYDEEKVTSGNGSYDPSNLLFSLHSHPAGKDNLGPSGYVTNPPKSSNYYPYTGEDNDCYTMINNLNLNPKSKHYIYHKGVKSLIYYDNITASNKKTQNEQGLSKGVMNSASQMRRKILGY